MTDNPTSTPGATDLTIVVDDGAGTHEHLDADLRPARRHPSRPGGRLPGPAGPRSQGPAGGPQGRRLHPGLRRPADGDDHRDLAGPAGAQLVLPGQRLRDQPLGPAPRPAAAGRDLISADDDLHPLELLDLGVAGGRHRLAQRADQVHGAVGGGGRAEQDLLQGADGVELRPLAPRQTGVPGLRAPVEARPGASAALASGEPTITASAPQAIALAMSPDRTTDPSAITCTYRPPDSSM